MNPFQSADESIVRAATHLGGTGMGRDYFVSVLADILPYVMLLALIYLFFSGKTKRGREKNRSVVYLTGVAVLFALGVRYLLALSIARPRPLDAVSGIHHLPFHYLDASWDASKYAFPSGHAIVVFTVAGTIYFSNRHPRLAKVLLAVAVIVAVARVVAGFHYATDVIGGALLGLGIARVVTWQGDYVRQNVR